MARKLPKGTEHPQGTRSPCCGAQLRAPANALIRSSHVLPGEKRRWRCVSCSKTWRSTI
jgi:hypothetical protein